MNIDFFEKNKWLSFILLLLFYVVIIALAGRDELVADELRYAQFAENLSKAFYSPPPPNINLWNGPGYPIVLWVLHHVLHIPFSIIRFVNAFFLAFSVLFLFKSLLIMTNKKKAFFGSLALVLFYPILQDLPSLLTETISVFLLSWTMYLVINVYEKSKLLDWLLLGLALGLLSLTKVIFGYVVPVSILLVFVFSKWNRLMLLTLLTWAIVVSPWLFYTQSITGNVFYWGNSGGMSLYWMSSVAPNEYGDWNNETFTAGCNSSGFCNADKFEEFHKKDIEKIVALPKIDQDAEYKRLAWQNILNHPIKYLKNCGYNLSRMFFGYPFSYTPFQVKTLVRFPSGIVILLSLIFCAFQLLLRCRKTKDYQLFMASILFVYIGGTTLLSAYPRMVNPVVPLVILLVISLLPLPKKKKIVPN